MTTTPPLTPPLRPPWSYPTTAWSVVLVPPSEEPITVANAKLRAGLDWPDSWDPRQQLMADHITAARQKVEIDTWLALITQTRQVFVQVPEAAPVPWPRNTLPLQSVLSVINGADGTALDAADYTPDAAGRIVLAAGSWVLDVVVGFGTAADLALIEAPLVQAVALLATHYATLGRDLVAADDSRFETPFGYEDLIAPYRPVWVV